MWIDIRRVPKGWQHPKNENCHHTVMPSWPEKQLTHYMVYDNTGPSGKPISPTLGTLEEVKRWLSDNRSIFANTDTTHYHWIFLIESGCWAPKEKNM